MSNTKKIALMSTLVLLLAVTAVFNFLLAGTGSPSIDAGASVKVNYFTSYRSERNSTRSEEFIQLDSVIAAYTADTEEYAAAVQRKQELVEVMEDELVMETVLKAMGFSDAAVAIGDSEYINVFINSNELTADMLTKIHYALEVEQQVREGNIIIMPVYAES
ncbi:MAG: SpoIIIAH-like family protein [Clostridia bacterium]|nr:SpoIIIAH-like family protein [Clostridia bacterium]